MSTGVNDPNEGVVWKVGFMNSDKQFLTAESFGFKVNASGTALKKKQAWSIEQDPAEQFLYIRSCMKRYMTSDKYGNVTVEAEEKCPEGRFFVEYSTDGKWAFKHATHGYYLSGFEDQVKCFDKPLSDKNWWGIQLYVHPQIYLRNVNRKRYAHLNKDTNELECSELVPWGTDSIVFIDFVDGKYTLKSSDNRYLNRDGTLQTDVDASTMFSLEIHSGYLAFKDSEGRYLTVLGNGTMKGINKTISKGVLFTIEVSRPQVQIVSYNGKSVSVKQGLDVIANQGANAGEIGNTEMFHMEYNKATKSWAFRACTNKYWCFQTVSGTIQASNAETTPDCFFTIDWQDNGTVGIKGPDGKYLSNKQTGILYSTGSHFEDINKFKIIIVNRSVLVLKCDFGFVGLKGNQYICNKSKYEVLHVTSAGDGTYTIQGPDGKFWNIGNDKMICSSENPSKFQFQILGRSSMAIRAPNGCYLKGEHTGFLKANERSATSSLWEF